MSAEEIGIYFGIVAAVAAGAWAVYLHVSAKHGGDKAGRQISDGDENIQVGQVGRDVTIIKGAPVDVNAIVERLEEAARREGALSAQLEKEQERTKQLTEAVQALADQRRKPDAPPGIDEALALLAEGKTEAAESVFQEVKERRKAEGAGAFKEAAAAARHIGALAFLHDTDKAQSAYREAVELDPDNADGWNQLGHLLLRTGDLEDAEHAFGRVLSLGNRVDDEALIAIATGNLGILFFTRGDFDRAEGMYRKALEINEALGRKEGIANQYGNLANLYQIRGDLDRAVEMHLKSLEIEEALGRKEGMASEYGNLGEVYRIRGDLDRAEEMYKKALALNEALGSKQGMASNYGNLGSLYKSRGDLDSSEEMYLKGLEIDEVLGRKEGMASKYGNLGMVYKTRGDLDRAEEMHLKSLEIEEALGHKEGMANQYGNLGNLYSVRGDLTRAEERYQKALALFREVGAAPMVEQVKGLLAELRDEQP